MALQILSIYKAEKLEFSKCKKNKKFTFKFVDHLCYISMQTISIPYDNSNEVFHIFATYGGKGRSHLV